MTDTYENLANAIIIQAAKDYRAASKALKKPSGGMAALKTVRECERFFRSDWFRSLTSVDGRAVLEQLRKEAL